MCASSHSDQTHFAELYYAVYSIFRGKFRERNHTDYNLTYVKSPFWPKIVLWDIYLKLNILSEAVP